MCFMSQTRKSPDAIYTAGIRNIFIALFVTKQLRRRDIEEHPKECQGATHETSALADSQSEHSLELGQATSTPAALI